MPNKLTLSEESVLAAFEKQPINALPELEETTGIARRTLQRILAKLAKDELIQVLGETNNRAFRRVYQPQSPQGILAVLSSGDYVGDLQYGDGLYRFSYYEKYNGLGFPGIKKGEINEASVLFSFFENLLPEYERRDRLLAGEVEIAKVLAGLKNTHGAVEFIKKEELFKYKSSYSDRPNWITVKNKILGENSFPNLINVDVMIPDEIINALAGSKEHSQLSGYQTKIDVTVDWDTMNIVESQNANYLLKPRNLEKSNYFNPPDDGVKRYYPYLAVNEHLFMSFAKNELGFDVPYSAIIKADKDFHYLTKRYDRHEKYRYEQLDFAQLLSVPSKLKYKSSSEVLFQKIGETLNVEYAPREALRFYFYSYLIKHADLHLKNLGALHIGQGKYVLAPLYDVISVGIYKGNGNDLGLPMQFPFKKPINWNMGDFYKLGKIIGVSKSQFKKDARKIAESFIMKMPEYIQKVRDLEQIYPLEIQTTRIGSSLFSDRLQSFYNEKIISLKKYGILEELNLLDIAGGPLTRSMRAKAKKERVLAEKSIDVALMT